MKFLVTAALALTLLTFEAVLVKQLGLSVARIDVTVVLIAFLALRASLVEGAVSAFVVGYLLDLMSGEPTGLYTFLAVLVFLFGRLGENLVDIRSPATFVVFAMGLDATHGVLARFFSWMVSKQAPGLSTQFGSLVFQVLMTGAAALPLFFVLRRLDSDADRPRPGLLG